MAFHLTRKAYDDLREIARYTERVWGRQQRNKYLQRLDACFHDLDEHPGKGQRGDDIRPGYCKFRLGKHVIFYQESTPGDIAIVRVLHGSMDIERHLADEN